MLSELHKLFKLIW